MATPGSAFRARPRPDRGRRNASTIFHRRPGPGMVTTAGGVYRRARRRPGALRRAPTAAVPDERGGAGRRTSREGAGGR
ncbi:hypothetical protein QJS66_19110 [Kocuria rhizophila]|nr:hypothetical protein QJS66_19110 [Kocuria rhizophila]